MILSELKNLNDGAKIYLCPVSYRYGGETGISLAGTGMRLLYVRLIVRQQGTIIWDASMSMAELMALLSDMPEDLRIQAEHQLADLKAPRTPLTLAHQKTLAFTKPLIMGVLNVTPDSFSDGGQYMDPVHALSQARRMMAEGADIIDIGGESTRPGAEPVWEGEEADRVVPVIEALKDDGVPLSIDTRHSFVMDRATKAGAEIINDVSALTYDPESMAVAAQADVPIVLMHAQGQPKSMQENPRYQHTLLDVYDYLKGRIDACVAAGISREKLIIDPGIGFGKRMVQDNLALINGVPLFHTLGLPILFGASRKSFIGAITGEENASKRLSGSLAAAMKAVELGAQIVRVHDVAETRAVLKMAQAFHDAAMMDSIPLVESEA